jgi:hypothetical protein
MDSPIFIPAQPRVRRQRADAATLTPAPPAQALILQAAAYEEAEENAVVLTFDRAIDIVGLDGAQITVNDGVYVGSVFAATGAATMLSPASVRIVMNPIGEAELGLVTLTASAASGIVAVDDGGTWAGLTDEPLPFP